MNKSEIPIIANAEYYGDKKLSKKYDVALRKINAMVREGTFEYKDEVTRIKKDWYI